MSWLFFLILVFSPTQIKDFSPHHLFVVWNIGQGQWTTAIESEKCLHFDAGGEKRNLELIQRTCGHKENYFYLSHWDMDHISFMKWVATHLQTTCISQRPRGQASSAKKKLLAQFTDCRLQNRDVWEVPTREKTPDTNSSSHVQIYQEQVLIPGDSPITEEIYWSHGVAAKNIKVLILGHHGSRTSTGEYLLSQLPHIKLAVASSRYARYRHPHAETLLRLQKNKTPVLTTEDWGHIGIEI